VSEIEFCTLYVVAERWILGCILRVMHAKIHFSDTLVRIRRVASSPLSFGIPRLSTIKSGCSSSAFWTASNPSDA
jgi:hypothetical protein